jgi:CBS domain-containing protein
MAHSDIGAIPVQDGGVLRGMLTDRDIVVRCLSKGCDPANTTVSEIMTSKLFACHDNQEVDEVAQMMKDKKVRRVVVLNDDDRPVGIVSIGDIAAHANVRIAAETLKTVSQSVHSQ